VYSAVEEELRHIDSATRDRLWRRLQDIFDHSQMRRSQGTVALPTPSASDSSSALMHAAPPPAPSLYLAEESQVAAENVLQVTRQAEVSEFTIAPNRNEPAIPIPDDFDLLISTLLRHLGNLATLS
jgi:hypothetical protein